MSSISESYLAAPKALRGETGTALQPVGRRG